MSNSVQGSQSRETQKRTTSGWIANATVALLPVLACFLAGATRKWEEGVVIIVLGFYLFLRPPRFSLGATANLVLFTLVVLAAVALLPAHWFFQPEWRASLVNSFTIQLPSTLSPQPWITLGYLVSFAAGLSWLYVVSTQDLIRLLPFTCNAPCFSTCGTEKADHACKRCMMKSGKQSSDTDSLCCIARQ